MNLLVVPMASSLRCFEPGAVMLRTRLELNAYGGRPYSPCSRPMATTGDLTAVVLRG